MTGGREEGGGLDIVKSVSVEEQRGGNQMEMLKSSLARTIQARPIGPGAGGGRDFRPLPCLTCKRFRGEGHKGQVISI